MALGSFRFRFSQMGAREETIILYNFGRKVPGLWSDFGHMLISELITPARDGHTDQVWVMSLHQGKETFWQTKKEGCCRVNQYSAMLCTIIFYFSVLKILISSKKKTHTLFSPFGVTDVLSQPRFRGRGTRFYLSTQGSGQSFRRAYSMGDLNFNSGWKLVCSFEVDVVRLITIWKISEAWNLPENNLLETKGICQNIFI